MGLFSNRKVNVVNSSVQRVIPDELLPNSALTGVLNAIFQDINVSESVVDTLMNGIGIKVDRLYKYGQSKYIYGLPSGQVQSASQGMAEAKAVIEAIEGKPITVMYSRIGAPNILHQGWKHLHQNYDYDPETNTLKNITVDYGWGAVPIPGDFDKNVYLDDMQVVVNDVDDLPEMTEMWGIPPNAGYTPTRSLNEDGTYDAMSNYSPIIKGTFDGVRITYRWRLPDSYGGNMQEDERPVIINTKTATFDYVVSADQDRDFIHVKYEVAGVTKYWMYQLGSGSHPTLDIFIDSPAQISGSYYPFAYFRYNKKRMDEDKNSRDYKDSKKFTDYLGLDYDAVIDAVHDTEGRDEAQVKDLESAMLFLAIPANSKDQADLLYLWEFMDRWFYNSEGNYGDPSVDAPRLMPNQTLDFDTDGVPITKTAIIIEDKKFKMALSNGGIYKKNIAKRIGPIGTVESDRGETWTERDVRVGSNPDEYRIERQRVKVMTHIYRKQTSTEYCEELHILSMKMLYYVWGNYTAMGNDEEDILMIPIDKAITDEMTALKKEQLIARSLHFLFNSRQILTIKWYQTTFWSMIIMIVVAIISVFIGGSDGGALLAGVLAGSTAAAAVLVNALVLNLISSIAMQVVFSAIAEELGINATLILAVAALAAGMYGRLSAVASGNVAAPWANTLIQAANGLTSGIGGAMESIQADWNTELESIRTELEDELDALAALNRELAGNSAALSPFVIFGEKPDDFYNRTVHSGNIGMVGVEAISTFVEDSLRLPTFNETMFGQQFAYG